VGQYHRRYRPHPSPEPATGVRPDHAAGHQVRWHQVRQTESGTIWLDARKTSPYAFYQFWLGTADADVYKFLRYFSFLSVAEIAAIEEADKARDGKPEAQRILAEQVTELVHGKAALAAAQRIPQPVQQRPVQPDRRRLRPTGAGRPAALRAEQRRRQPDRRVANGGLAKSKSEARTFIQSGAVSINGNKADSIEHRFTADDRLFGRFSLLKRGKKNYALIEWQA
jgi:tyrosyl-tRNA synthetase